MIYKENKLELKKDLLRFTDDKDILNLIPESPHEIRAKLAKKLFKEARLASHSGDDAKSFNRVLMAGLVMGWDAQK